MQGTLLHFAADFKGKRYGVVQIMTAGQFMFADNVCPGDRQSQIACKVMVMVKAFERCICGYFDKTKPLDRD